jgi:hypothetical protein
MDFSALASHSPEVAQMWLTCPVGHANLFVIDSRNRNFLVSRSIHGATHDLRWTEQ